MTVAHVFYEPIQDGFCCHYCEKLIEEGEAVYMCRDASYCSAVCRRKGRRVQMVQMEFGRTVSGSVMSTIDSAMSDSSHTSSAVSRSPRPAAAGGLLGWILGKVGRKLASMVEGADLLRTVSSQAVTGLRGLGLANSESDTVRLGLADDSSRGASRLDETGLARHNCRHFEADYQSIASGDDVATVARGGFASPSNASSDFVTTS